VSPTARVKDTTGESGIVFQGAPYEGMTCDWLELAFAAGGSDRSKDGRKATIDSPQNVAATKLMADARRASILGGGNSVISTFSKNPGGALAVVDFLASQDW
jgi:ABC-type glycerol-3-phosphate transport system substrate-binding protein